MNSIEKLDAVLKWMVENHQYYESAPSISTSDAYFSYFMPKNIDSTLLRIILEKLFKDGYLISNGSEYMISFEGLIFYEQDGYLRQNAINNEKANLAAKEKDLIEKQIQSTLDTNDAVKSTATWNIRLFWATLITAIASLLTPILSFKGDREKSALESEIKAKQQQIQQLQQKLSHTSQIQYQLKHDTIYVKK